MEQKKDKQIPVQEQLMEVDMTTNRSLHQSTSQKSIVSQRFSRNQYEEVKVQSGLDKAAYQQQQQIYSNNGPLVLKKENIIMLNRDQITNIGKNISQQQNQQAQNQYMVIKPKQQYFIKQSKDKKNSIPKDVVQNLQQKFDNNNDYEEIQDQIQPSFKQNKFSILNQNNQYQNEDIEIDNQESIEGTITNFNSTTTQVAQFSNSVEQSLLSDDDDELDEIEVQPSNDKQIIGFDHGNQYDGDLINNNENNKEQFTIEILNNIELVDQEKKDNRCKELERFQIHMCLENLYHEFNPMIEYYKQFLPVNHPMDKTGINQLSKALGQANIQDWSQNLRGNTNVNKSDSNQKNQKVIAIQNSQKQKRNTKPINRYNQAKVNNLQIQDGDKINSAVTQCENNLISRESSHIQNTIQSPTKETEDHFYQQQQAQFSENTFNSPAHIKDQNIQIQNTNNNMIFPTSTTNSIQPLSSAKQQDNQQVLTTEKRKPKMKVVKRVPRKLIMNTYQTKYPIIKKIAKYEFNLFLSNRDMFAPVNGQLVLDGGAGNGTTYVTNGLPRDPDDDYFDIYWMDPAGQRHIDRFTQLKIHQRINHFPGMNILCRKNELGKLLNFMNQKFPSDFEFFPKTWVFPKEQRQFELHIQMLKDKEDEDEILIATGQISKRNVERRNPVFIVKPEANCQGKGIFLIKDLNDLERQLGGQHMQAFQNNFQSNTIAGQPRESVEHFHCVVQEYIERPLLIDKMKFDLRLYVLVLGVDPLRIFLFKDGLARLATTAYTKPNDKNMNNMCMHLTNYAINKNSLNFSKNYTAAADFVGSKRSLKFVMRYLRKQCNADTIKLMSEIKDLTIKTIISAQPHLAHQYKCFQIDDYENSLCFEILGIDIMLDDNFKPYLIELNHAPSFATDSSLDEKIKGQVIYDTINLLGLSQKRKKNYRAVNKIRTELRKVSQKKINVTQEMKDLCRKDFDDLRNQYESRNKGMFDMIYPILDEITLDPIPEKMRPYEELLQYAQIHYCLKNNMKIPEAIQRKIGKIENLDKYTAKTIYTNQMTGKQFMNSLGISSSMNKHHSGQNQMSKKNYDNNGKLNKLKDYYKSIKSKVFTNNVPKGKKQFNEQMQNQQQQSPSKNNELQQQQYVTLNGGEQNQLIQEQDKMMQGKQAQVTAVGEYQDKVSDRIQYMNERQRIDSQIIQNNLEIERLLRNRNTHSSFHSQESQSDNNSQMSNINIKAHNNNELSYNFKLSQLNNKQKGRFNDQMNNDQKMRQRKNLQQQKLKIDNTGMKQDEFIKIQSLNIAAPYQGCFQNCEIQNDGVQYAFQERHELTKNKVDQSRFSQNRLLYNDLINKSNVQHLGQKLHTIDILSNNSQSKPPTMRQMQQSRNLNQQATPNKNSTEVNNYMPPVLNQQNSQIKNQYFVMANSQSLGKNQQIDNVVTNDYNMHGGDSNAQPLTKTQSAQNLIDKEAISSMYDPNQNSQNVEINFINSNSNKRNDQNQQQNQQKINIEYVLSKKGRICNTVIQSKKAFTQQGHYQEELILAQNENQIENSILNSQSIPKSIFDVQQATDHSQASIEAIQRINNQMNQINSRQGVNSNMICRSFDAVHPKTGSVLRQNNLDREQTHIHQLDLNHKIQEQSQLKNCLKSIDLPPSLILSQQRSQQMIIIEEDPNQSNKSQKPLNSCSRPSSIVDNINAAQQNQKLSQQSSHVNNFDNKHASLRNVNPEQLPTQSQDAQPVQFNRHYLQVQRNLKKQNELIQNTPHSLNSMNNRYKAQQQQQQHSTIQHDVSKTPEIMGVLNAKQEQIKSLVFDTSQWAAKNHDYIKINKNTSNNSKHQNIKLNLNEMHQDQISRINKQSAMSQINQQQKLSMEGINNRNTPNGEKVALVGQLIDPMNHMIQPINEKEAIAIGVKKKYQDNSGGDENLQQLMQFTNKMQQFTKNELLSKIKQKSQKYKLKNSRDYHNHMFLLTNSKQNQQLLQTPINNKSNQLNFQADQELQYIKNNQINAMQTVMTTPINKHYEMISQSAKTGHPSNAQTISAQATQSLQLGQNDLNKGSRIVSGHTKFANFQSSQSQVQGQNRQKVEMKRKPSDFRMKQQKKSLKHPFVGGNNKQNPGGLTIQSQIPNNSNAPKDNPANLDFYSIDYYKQQLQGLQSKSSIGQSHKIKPPQQQLGSAHGIIGNLNADYSDKNTRLSDNRFDK